MSKTGLTEGQLFGPVGIWTVAPPAGLTQTGAIRRFQDRTVQRLQEAARGIAQPTLEQLQATVREFYQEGSGELLSTLQYRIDATRDGVDVSFLAGTNHLVYLTALAGEPTVSPGHWITKHGQGKLRFFWKNPPGGGGPGVYGFRTVEWKPRRTGGADVIAQVLGRGAAMFERVMIDTHERALVEFIQQNAEPATRSPRVSISTENIISPQY